MTKLTDEKASTTPGPRARRSSKDLRDLAATLRAGEPLESRFTVRTYKISPPPKYGGEGVRRVRELLAMSQAAFAAFLGADPSTVQSWEQVWPAESTGVSTFVRDRSRPGPLAQAARGVSCHQRPPQNSLTAGSKEHIRNLRRIKYSVRRAACTSGTS